MDNMNGMNCPNHYDVGIFGVWSGCNYGSVATYYALNQVISSMGKTVLMIDKPILTAEDAELKETHSRRFGREHYHISKQYHLDQMHQLNHICDSFLIGSDQVWNYGISKNFGRAFYLDFVSAEKKKIAYAVSFGHEMDFAPGEERQIIAEYMSFFDGIGTREADGVRLCKECYGIQAEQVIDPVFLAMPEIYDMLIERSSKKEDVPFIVTYILDPSPEKREAILYLQEKFGGIKVINLLDGLPWLFDKNKKLMNLPNCVEDVQVEDWLYYLKNAAFILTDSCHGASFALIFKKNFIAITNRRRGYSRFQSLSQLFKFEDHLVTDPADIITNSDLLAPINYELVSDIMKAERRRCNKWLYDILSFPKKSAQELIKRNVIGIFNPINYRAIDKPKNGICDDLTVRKIIMEKGCSGCGACQSICPKNAITFIQNSEGFWVPEIDRNKCVNCGLCLKKCTSNAPVYKNRSNPKCYAVMASDEIRKISSSGGMFTIAAEYVLKKGGYVCGAAYREDYSVEHIIIDNRNELGRLRGSKYMQSYAGGIFPDVKELLQKGEIVLFTGMPCQVAGLYSYLGREYEGLYTIDLLCHGITSYKVFKKYHSDVLKGRKLSRLEFKEKEPWGWHAGVNAYFTDGTKYSEPLETDMYFIAYLKSIAKNTICGKCVSNKLPRQGDLTIGDFWGIARSDEEMYDNKGTSVVLLNNQRAEAFFDGLKTAMKKVKEEPLAAAIRGNRIIQEPYRLHKNRDRFFEYFDRLDFTSLTKGCFYNELYKYYKKELLRQIPEKLHEYYYLAKAAVEKSQGRKIVTWADSKDFEYVLKKFFGRDVAFSVAKSKARINDETIFSISKIKRRRNEFYIVALDPKNHEDTYKLLNDYGYEEIQDFICRFPRPIILNEYDLSEGMYLDLYGNSIEGYAGKLGKIIFGGCNNHIVIGDKTAGAHNLHFDLTSNAYIEIQEENKFNAISHIQVKGYSGKSEVIIQKGCRFTDVLCRLYNNQYVSSIRIDKDCTFESNLELHANSGKKIVIGKDCMFSHKIDLWAGDGHSIFDTTTGENINSVYEKQPTHKNAIVIGEHVWVSKGSFIMHGTNIGNGSIVGAGSVVKGQFPNNCTIGGNPAKIIRRNSAWSRDMVTDNPERCGKEYFALTAAKAETEEKTSVMGAAMIESDQKKANDARSVLILGGTGRMSSELTALCMANGCDVTIAVRGRHKAAERIASVKKILFDRLNEKATREALSGRFFDVVFDCSGFVPQSVDWVLSSVKTDRYIYISSFETYRNIQKSINVCEDNLPIESKSYKETIKIGEDDAWYAKGKYNSELLIANKYPDINYAIVRVPFVMSLDNDFDDDYLSSRVLRYVSAVVNEETINGKNLDRSYNFTENKDEARFLYFLSQNSFKGVINFASQGTITMRNVIQYVEKRIGKKAVIDHDYIVKFPFSTHPEITMDLKKCFSLSFNPLKLEDWMYKKLDRYIEYCEGENNGRERIKKDKIQRWLITGGSTGIGKALALRLHELGYVVAVTSRDISRLSKLPNDIIKVQLDARDIDSCMQAVKTVEEKAGRIDVLANCIGLSHVSTFEETPDDIGDNIIETNYWGIANMIKVIIPHMRKNRNGTVINMSCSRGFCPRNYGSYYVASKFAVESLTKNLKFECQRFMRFMSVECGGLNTGIAHRQIVIHSQINEYKKLPPLYSHNKEFVNKMDKVIDAIIKTTNYRKLPRDLVLGWDACQQFTKVMDSFKRQVEDYKSISITTDEAKAKEVALDDVELPRNKELKIQNWLITGGSGGFGKVLALRLHELGYTVMITSRDISKLEEFPDDIYRIESRLDSSAECKEVIHKAIEIMGSVDVLVNNATSNCWSSFEECPYETMRDVFYTNYTLPQYMIKALLPYMRAEKNGTVINITSIAGIQPRARVSTYSAAKAAMEGLTRTLKSECRRFARFMAVELVCMRTKIMIHNPVIDPLIPDYQNLGRYTHTINNIPNRKDIAAQQIINVTNQKEIPYSLLIGTESYLIACNEIKQAEKEFTENKDMMLSVCEKVEPLNE